ncbi:MAG: guanylate kinase [Candidatus Paceibacterota bacterium]|jgi:guanylate kinase
MNKVGKLIIVVGPTGSGKSVLIEHVQNLHPELVAPVSCTTRAMRPGEKDGTDYHFVDEAEFKRRITAGDFLEWASIDGHLYGTPKAEVVRCLKEGKTLLVDMDVQGVRQVRKSLQPDEVTTIYIDGGTWSDLEHRVRSRAPITETELMSRRKRFEYEKAFKSEADFIVKNPEGEVEQAKKDLAIVIDSLLVS